MTGVSEKYDKTKILKQIFLFLFIITGLSIFPVLNAQDANINLQNKGIPVDNILDKRPFSETRNKKLNVGINTWNANWIWQEADGPANTWSCFRKTFLLDEIPLTAKARIAVDSKYWLWINGKEVILEGGLKRGPTPNDTYYDLIDIKKFLQTGMNVIAVQVWYFGKDGFSHHDSGKGGLLFECDLDDLVIKSDTTWKMIIHPSFERATVNIQPNVRLSESLIRYNAVNDTIGAWKDVDYDDSSWPVAVEKGIPPAAPWNSLSLRPIPQWRNSELRDYESISVEGQQLTLPYTTSMRTLVVADLPYNAQITPYLEIETTESKEIFIYSDSYHNWRDKGIMAEYVAAPGTSQYESLGWMNGHKIIYSIPVGVTVKSIKYRESGYDTEMAGSFVSDDVFYNKLWQKAQRTLYLAMRDNYMDCPDRERALWWGDAVIHIGKSFYALDRKSDLLSRKSISNLIKWQREDKVLYTPVPSGNWNNELPAQMLASVGEFGFWNYFMYTGDSATIVEVYPQVKAYLDLWMFKSNGLLTYRSGNWDWSDWGEDIDSEIIQNAWYYLALKAAKEMAVLSGNSADTLLYRNRMQDMQNSFNDVFWNGQAYRSPSYSGQTDDRANAMAVLAGFADKTKWSKIRSLLLTRRGASPYMEKYVLEALFLMGYERDALARMKHPDRYLNMVESMGTTLTEYFVSGGSNNHAWSGGPLILLSRYSAGVAPLAPSFDVYRVFPQEGSLNYIRSVVPSVKGNIEVEINKDSLNYQLKLISPYKTKAIVGIPVLPHPDKKIKSISLNDVTYWPDNHATGQDSVVYFRGVTGKYMVFELNPGIYEINAELENAFYSGVIREEYKDFQCRVSPNPVVDNLHIQFDQINTNLTEINIFNLRGKLIKSHKTYNHEVTLKVIDLLPGMYFIKVNNGQNTRTAYFVKQ